MSLNFLEWDCPSCGKHNREDTNTWCYGTPIRHCRHCDGDIHNAITAAKSAKPMQPFR